MSAADDNTIGPDFRHGILGALHLAAASMPAGMAGASMNRWAHTFNACTTYDEIDAQLARLAIELDTYPAYSEVRRVLFSLHDHLRQHAQRHRSQARVRAHHGVHR